MAIKQITYRRMSDGGYWLPHITHVGNLNGEWPEMRREEAALSIDAGIDLFYVFDGINTAIVEVVKPTFSSSSWYLRTHPDNVLTDNLLSLPALPRPNGLFSLGLLSSARSAPTYGLGGGLLQSSLPPQSRPIGGLGIINRAQQNSLAQGLLNQPLRQPINALAQALLNPK